MIPPDIIAGIVAASTAARKDIAAIYGIKNDSKENMMLPGSIFCSICYGYGFWEDEPDIPITYTERFHAPSQPCSQCDSENDYYGEEDSNITPPWDKEADTKSMSEILNKFRKKNKCAESSDIQEHR